MNARRSRNKAKKKREHLQKVSEQWKCEMKTKSKREREREEKNTKMKNIEIKYKIEEKYTTFVHFYL